MEKFVDVILPLPLHACFTYSLPEDMAESVQIGCRVVVPFGRKKYYTAIVQNIHYSAPAGYEVKEVSDDTRPYGVIHRLASTEQSKGVASACLQWCYRQIPNLRADTHRDNHILQHILKKHGFQYCGIIYLLNGDERLAFQKL